MDVWQVIGIALGSSVVGSALTGGITLWVDERRRRDSRKLRRQERREARRAWQREQREKAYGDLLDALEPIRVAFADEKQDLGDVVTERADNIYRGSLYLHGSDEVATLANKFFEDMRSYGIVASPKLGWSAEDMEAWNRAASAFDDSYRALVAAMRSDMGSKRGAEVRQSLFPPEQSKAIEYVLNLPPDAVPSENDTTPDQ